MVWFSLQQLPGRQVAGHRRLVGLGPGPRRNAVEVADRPGRRRDDRQLLLPGECVPPGVDLLGGAVARQPRQRLVGRVGHAAVLPLDLFDGGDPTERRQHPLLRGHHPLLPGGDLGHEVRTGPSAGVRVGLDGGRLLRAGAVGALPEPGDPLHRVAATGLEVGAVLEELLHLVGVVVGLLVDAAQRQRHRVRPAAERGDRLVVAGGVRALPVADPCPAGDEAAEIVDLGGGRAQLLGEGADRDRVHLEQWRLGWVGRDHDPGTHRCSRV